LHSYLNKKHNKTTEIIKMNSNLKNYIFNLMKEFENYTGNFYHWLDEKFYFYELKNKVQTPEHKEIVNEILVDYWFSY